MVLVALMANNEKQMAVISGFIELSACCKNTTHENDKKERT